MMIQRRSFLKALLSLPAFFSFRAFAAPKRRTTRVAFGSCALQDEAQPLWDVIGQTRPEAFAFLGDNIYAETDDMALMKKKYDMLAAIPQFARFRRQVPIVATYDDHDFGWNDVGAQYPKKHESKELMLNFFGEPRESARRKRDGVYESYLIGEGANSVQIILLDLRWFRGPLKDDGAGNYLPNDDRNVTMLGEEQWRWLEEQLRKPAGVRLLGSSIQLVSPDHFCEKWGNFPHEKARLYSMMDRLNIRNMIVLSGDMHFAELSAEKTPRGIDVVDITSSGINRFESADGIPNRRRVQLYDKDCNFGLITVDWESRIVLAQVLNSKGRPVIQTRIKV